MNIPEITQSNIPQPHRHFHADKIKRAGQLILLVIDHFTLLVAAKLVSSEKVEDLIEGVINLTTPIRHPGPITIVTDIKYPFNGNQTRLTWASIFRTKSHYSAQRSDTDRLTYTRYYTYSIIESRVN